MPVVLPFYVWWSNRNRRGCPWCILIPDYLKDFAGLRNKVVVGGLRERLEIWDERRWNEYSARMEKQAETIAEKLVSGF